MADMATTTATPLDTKAEAKAAKKAAKKKEPKPSFSDRWLNRQGWSRRLPLLPALVFIIILTQIPFLATLIISFMNWNANYPTEIFFGTLNNYLTVFTDAALRSSVLFTIVLTVTVVIVSLALGLGISLLLNRSFFGRGIVRTFMITPFLIVPVAAALLWKHAIYNPVYGLLNGILTWLGGPQPDWITDFPRLAIEVQLIWYWTPFMTLILLAGLQSRPGDVLEAANVDGANAWQTFTNITMLHMRRYLELGGLLGSANLPYTVYETLYSAQDYGLASAQGVVVVIFSIAIATFLLRTVSTLFEES